MKSSSAGLMPKRWRFCLSTTPIEVLTSRRRYSWRRANSAIRRKQSPIVPMRSKYFCNMISASPRARWSVSQSDIFRPIAAPCRAEMIDATSEWLSTIWAEQRQPADPREALIEVYRHCYYRSCDDVPTRAEADARYGELAVFCVTREFELEMQRRRAIGA